MHGWMHAWLNKQTRQHVKGGYQHVPAPLSLVRVHFLVQLVLQSVHSLLQELPLPIILRQHLLLNAGGVKGLLAVGAVQLLHSFLERTWRLNILDCALQVSLKPPGSKGRTLGDGDLSNECLRSRV